MMPDLPWYVWFGLGALMYPVMKRVILRVVGRQLRLPRPRMSVSVWQAVSKKKPPENAPTAWERIQSDE